MYGANVIEEKKKSFLQRLYGWLVTPMSFMFVVAGALSLLAGHISDAVVIMILFVMNVGVGAWHEAKADTALEKLRAKLNVVSKVKRDGVWNNIPSTELVPGDVLELTMGDLIPADVTFAEVKNVSVNEAVVTGESLPRQKANGEVGYSGSFLATGLAHAVVSKTGVHTYFGKTLSLVDVTPRRSQLEKDILSVSRFLSIISVVIMLVLTAVLFFAKLPLSEIATLDISMLIAGIPVALPTIMTLIISVGVMVLTGKSVIVRRLSSLEDLANVNLLLSDKTGTLTENRIAVTKMVSLAPDFSDADIWPLALSAAPRPDLSPLEGAIAAKAKEYGVTGFPILDFVPGDSERKRSTVYVERNGVRVALALGAPQTIKELSHMDTAESGRYSTLLAEAAQGGFRVLVLALSDNDREENMQPLAAFFLADLVRPEAHDAIDFMHEYGINVKMVTGDGYDVSTHVATELGLAGRVVRRVELEADFEAVKKEFAGFAGFAEVMPKNKYDLVMAARTISRTPHYVVAVTGDGVNDVPPVKAADVGIAVANAVEALKGTADIVLTAPGIAVIKDAIIEARKIFVRLYNYSVYRVSESFRLIVTIATIGVLFHTYPLTPIQIIMIALLNDVPIITLAYDRVDVPHAPATINPRKRFTLSTIFGLVGIANSLILLWVATAFLHAPWAIIQTIFFLKLTVSGHMLIYLAHTEKPWYSFLPSKQVLWATTLTQLIASAIAFFGFLTTPISFTLIVAVWVWSFLWMQIGELVKQVYARIAKI